MCCCSKRVMYVWHSMPHMACAACYVHHTIYTPYYLCSYYTVPCAVYMYMYIYTYTYTCIYTMLWYTHSRSWYDTGLSSATWAGAAFNRSASCVVLLLNANASILAATNIVSVVLLHLFGMYLFGKRLPIWSLRVACVNV